MIGVGIAAHCSASEMKMRSQRRHAAKAFSTSALSLDFWAMESSLCHLAHRAEQRAN